MMKLSLGPLHYFWNRSQVENFYAQMLEMPLDVIYLGETVCAKRRELKTDEWIDLAKQLSGKGKQIIISTMALIDAGSALGTVKKLCNNGEITVEANEMGAVHLLSENKVPFVAGPSLNIYNQHTLLLLHKLGLQRWVAPVELPKQALQELLESLPADIKNAIETEVFSFGKLPLAFSARCYTARAHNLPKDDCLLKCIDYPEGLAADSQEGEEFLCLNGIQTQSGSVTHLLPQWREMQDIGVDLMRLSPLANNMSEIIQSYAAALKGDDSQLNIADSLVEYPICNGYWFGDAGKVRVA